MLLHPGVACFRPGQFTAPMIYANLPRVEGHTSDRSRPARDKLPALIYRIVAHDRPHFRHVRGYGPFCAAEGESHLEGWNKREHVRKMRPEASYGRARDRPPAPSTPLNLRRHDLTYVFRRLWHLPSEGSRFSPKCSKRRSMLHHVNMAPRNQGSA